MLLKKCILLSFVLLLLCISQSYAYLTVKFSITNKENGNTKNFAYYIDTSTHNNVNVDNDYSTINLRLEKVGNYYKLTWTISPKVNLTYTAELFNSSGEHPEWVGGNPYGPKNLNTGDNDIEYWYPIKPEEIGPEYNHLLTTKSPIPLGAVILTLIAIPLIVLRKR